MSSSPKGNEPAPYGSAHDLPSFVEMKQQIKAFKALTSVLMRGQRPKIIEIEKQMNTIADRVDRFYELLGPRHWTFNDWMSLKTIDEILASDLGAEEAEHRVVEMYLDEKSKVHISRLRTIDGLSQRHHLIVRAREDFDAGRFDACTILLISVMDGFVNDFQADKRQGLAARSAEEMVAWDSVAGHHLGLTNALKPFLKTIKKRVDDEVFEVHRHGIVHGSVVHYNNAVVASKAWNLLFAVVDWSISLEKKVQDDEKPPPPGLKETFRTLAEHGRMKKAREEFEAREVSASESDFDQDEVVVVARTFIEAWQKGQWGRIVPFMPHGWMKDRRPGDAAEHTKSWFEMHEITGVELHTVEYPQSSVAVVCGKATIDNVTADLRLRWVRYDDSGDISLNDEPGSWHLAVVPPSSYLVDENGDRLR